MNDIEIIKNQIKILNDLRQNNNPLVKEHVSQIREKYRIVEDDSPRDIERYNVPNATEDEIEDNEGKPDDTSQGYRISGGILVLHGDSSKDVELTTDDKIAFQETMDEFVTEVSDLADFNTLNVYPNNVEWSGKLIDGDLDFIFTIGEDSGLYINGQMIKVDNEFLDLINKLQKYYQKFKSKWGKVLANRKKTKESPE